MNKPQPTSLKYRCEAAGIPYKTVFIRIKRGWTEARAMSTPVDSEEKPKLPVKKEVTLENVRKMIPKVKGEMRDAFEVCYGVKFVPGPQGTPWVTVRLKTVERPHHFPG